MRKEENQSVETLQLHPLLIVSVEIDAFSLPPSSCIVSGDDGFFQRLFDITHSIINRQAGFIPPVEYLWSVVPGGAR